jgi:hypothetical protein
MDLLNAVLIFIVFIGAIIYAVRPMFNTGSVNNGDMDLDSLQVRKRTIYKDIKEIEMDFELGKIAEADFHTARTELKQEAAAVITEINKLSSS